MAYLIAIELAGSHPTYKIMRRCIERKNASRLAMRASRCVGTATFVHVLTSDGDIVTTYLSGQVSEN